MREQPEGLTMDAARRLAGALVTIGHPYLPAALEQTAWIIFKTCVGILRPNGEMVTPLEQATAWVDAALDWQAGWPSQAGAKRFKELFAELYGSTQQPAFVPASAADLVARGMLHPRCDECEPDAPYCEWGGAKRHAREKEAAAVLEAATVTPKQLWRRKDIRTLGPAFDPDALLAIARRTVVDPNATEVQRKTAEETLLLNHILGGERTKPDPEDAEETEDSEA